MLSSEFYELIIDALDLEQQFRRAHLQATRLAEKLRLAYNRADPELMLETAREVKSQVLFMVTFSRALVVEAAMDVLEAALEAEPLAYELYKTQGWDKEIEQYLTELVEAAKELFVNPRRVTEWAERALNKAIDAIKAGYPKSAVEDLKEAEMWIYDMAHAYEQAYRGVINYIARELEYIYSEVMKKAAEYEEQERRMAIATLPR